VANKFQIFLNLNLTVYRWTCARIEILRDGVSIV
jgi:hypothetical protein